VAGLPIAEALETTGRLMESAIESTLKDNRP